MSKSCDCFFCLMIRRPPRSTRTDTLFPYTDALPIFRAAKVSRPVRIRRQPEGDRPDLDACIEAAVTHRIGATPDPRVYAEVTRRHRDLSVLVLLDISESSTAIVRGDVGSVLMLERPATALIAHHMTGRGHPSPIHPYRCSTDPPRG